MNCEHDRGFPFERVGCNGKAEIVPRFQKWDKIGRLGFFFEVKMNISKELYLDVLEALIRTDATIPKEENKISELISRLKKEYSEGTPIFVPTDGSKPRNRIVGK